MLHTNIPNSIWSNAHAQSQHCEGNLTMFEEDDTYWEPADDVNELYRQLSSKKYREIVRQQVE